MIMGPDSTPRLQRRTGKNLEVRARARRIIMFKPSELGVTTLAFLAVTLMALLLLLPDVFRG